jgi:phosphate ABC transporter permease protein PstC
MKKRLSKEEGIKFVLLLTATFSIFIIFLVFIFLFKEAFLAFQKLGWDILGTEFSGERYGLGSAILGSLLVTAGALTIAYPVGIGGGIFLSEIAPLWLRRALKPVIEVLAGIPSVIYGLIGALILAPYIYTTFNLVSGICLFSGGIIIGIMTLPIIISISDDSLKAVPHDIKNASLALGATPWTTIKKITFPAASSGIFAAATLGVGKAIGETMAVLMVVSATTRSADPWFDVFQSNPTLTSLVAGHIGEADFVKQSVLFAAGVFLFIIVGSLSVATDLLQRRIQKKFGK